jgi:glutamine amidotransferase
VVRRFPAGLDVPHMGWNRVWHGHALRLFEGIDDGARFYFVHSYYPIAANEGLAQAWCDYGVRFAAAIESGRVYATQFHPEKSHRAGIRLLENFAAIVKEAR